MNFAALFSLVLMLAAPFWETKPPEQWDDRELELLMTDSPWAQMVSGPGNASPAAPVQVYLATAGPIDQAERELTRRNRLKRKGPGPGQEPPPDDSLLEEYRAWLLENRGTNIILAIQMDRSTAFSDEAEIRRMEAESIMRVGRKKIKMTGHFPPSAGDPYLRIAFPRQVQLGDKNLVFELYLPGVPVPYRAAEFTLKSMLVMGKLEL
jgi:hypothetical protein